MVIGRRALGAMFIAVTTASGAAAQDRNTAVQDRPFLFSVSTPPTEARHTTVHLDSAFGERPFDLTGSDRPEQRFGIQAAMGHGLTFLGRVGLSSNEDDLRSSQQAELLYNVMEAPGAEASLAIGFGMRHESGGVNVLLGRLAAGRAFRAWRMDGNALFEKPFAADRDSVDVITTFGVSRRVASALRVGVELIGEDLEGFWEEDEAEGGARVLVGPSLRVAPPGKRWQVSVAGGPVIHATRSSRSRLTGGVPATDDQGYAVRASLGYAF